MITLIERGEALARIQGEGGGSGCLLCALLAGRLGHVWTLHHDERVVVLLPRYVTRWGHLLLVLRPHITNVVQADPDDWLHLCALARRAAAAADQVVRPRRGYLASTGSSGGELLHDQYTRAWARTAALR